ncbi:MAG: hypothetical protein RLY86_39 [Pseudomonadota bacterium]|jgi:hypothetical protein
MDSAPAAEEDGNQVTILSAKDFLAMVDEEYGDKITKSFEHAGDVQKVYKLLKDFGLGGSARVGTYKGQSYIIFKGTSWKRKFVLGTRYRTSHARVAHIAAARLAEAGSVTTYTVKELGKGLKLTLIVHVGWEIATELLKDDPDFVAAGSAVAVELLKAVLPTVATALVVAGLATTGLVALPAIAGIAVGLAVSALVDAVVDDKKLQEIIADAFRDLSADIDQQMQKAKSSANQIQRQYWMHEEQLIKNAIQGNWRGWRLR